MEINNKTADDKICLPSEFGSCLLQMAHLLANNDMASEEAFEKLKPDLFKWVSKPLVNALADHIRNFNFEKAGVVLKRVAQELNIEMKGNSHGIFQQ
jgi:TorA maturation chaperone TorD